MSVKLRRHLLHIPLKEASFACRGFSASSMQSRDHLEQIGETFLFGYHAALEKETPDILANQLNSIVPKFRGFAYEGAAMSLTLLDHLMPWPRNRLHAFLQQAGAEHIYMVHVGAGWALARLPWQRQWPPRWLDPLLRWLAVDGYGFHEGYFHWRRYIGRQTRPKHLSGYACQVFDQGLGRSLWFIEGADVGQISKMIATFPTARHADLWSGIGLACAYAGDMARSHLAELGVAAGSHGPSLAQGVAFAAKARQRAATPAVHTEEACQILCGLSAAAAATVTDDALADLPPDDIATNAYPAYEVWRQRIRRRFTYGEVYQ